MAERPKPQWDMTPPAEEAQAVASSDLFDYALLRDYLGFALRAPTRHRVLALCAFLAIVGVGLVAVFTLPIRYQVQAQILALRSPLMGTLSNPGLNREWDAPTRAARETMIRRDNLVALIKQTDFVNRYLEERAPAVQVRDWIVRVATGKERDREKLTEDLADALEDRLWVVATQEGTVTITFRWSNPETAQRIVQAAVQSFLEARYASEISAVGETIGILQGHDARVQHEIDDTINQLESKRATVRTSNRRQQQPVAAPVRARPVPPDEDVARLEGMLAARRRALADLESFHARRLEELNAQLTQRLAVYAPKHPEVMNIRQAIEGLQGPSPQVEALRQEVEELDREIEARGGHRSPLASKVSPVSPGMSGPLLPVLIETDDPRLAFEQRQLELLLRQHSYLLDRIDAARVELDTAQAAFKYRYSVITPPLTPKKPYKDLRLAMVAASILGGLALAVFVSTASDLHGRRVVERWQMERVLGLRVLAEVGK